MRKLRFVSAAMAMMMVAGTLVGCSGGNESQKSGSGGKNLKVAIICSAAGQNDNGYNQTAIEGAKKAEKDFGIEYKVVEPTTGVPKALESLADDGYQIIFNLEYDFEALINGTGGADAIAKMYPDTTFICMNDNPNKDSEGKQIHDNVISVLFDVDESSFVAGALTTLVNENAKELFGDTEYKFTSPENGGRSVGFIGGTNSNGITVFSYGYIEGINYEAEKFGVNYDGVASKAKEEGKLAIQVDANKDAQQPGYILTSVMKNTDVPVYEIIKASIEGKLDSMDRVQTYSLASGATSITDLAEISKHVQDSGKEKWEEIKAEVKDVESKIADGTIKVTNAQNGEEFDQSKCPNVKIK